MEAYALAMVVCLAVSLASGSRRGRGHGYQMCRIGDQGGYPSGTGYIATGSQNNPKLLGTCARRWTQGK